MTSKSWRAKMKDEGRGRGQKRLTSSGAVVEGSPVVPLLSDDDPPGHPLEGGGNDGRGESRDTQSKSSDSDKHGWG